MASRTLTSETLSHGIYIMKGDKIFSADPYPKAGDEKIYARRGLTVKPCLRVEAERVLEMMQTDKGTAGKYRHIRNKIYMGGSMPEGTTCNTPEYIRHYQIPYPIRMHKSVGI